VKISSRTFGYFRRFGHKLLHIIAPTRASGAQTAAEIESGSVVPRPTCCGLKLDEPDDTDEFRWQLLRGRLKRWFS
jgi:hypothetical protein